MALIRLSRVFRYFFTTGVRSAITKRAEEQVRRSLETASVHKEGEVKGQ